MLAKVYDREMRSAKGAEVEGSNLFSRNASLKRRLS